MEPIITLEDPSLNHEKTRKTSSQGITLIELTIFLILMGILASFVVPRISMVTEINLKTSARKLAETLLEVASMSTNLSTPFVVQYDLDEKKYCFKQAYFDPTSGMWSVRFADEKVEEVSPDPYTKTRCFNLEEGIYFKDIETLSGTGKKYEKGQIPQWFSPRGVTEPLVIHLADRKGRFFTLFLNRYGGRVDIRNGRWEYRDYLKELTE